MPRKQLKKCAFNSTGIIILVFFLGCDTTENYIREDPTGLYTSASKERPNVTNEELEFRKIEARNSIIAYKEFIQKYPQGQWISEAQKRMSVSDEEAFVRTIRLRTTEAFQGFIESYPESNYTLEIKDYFAWMEKSKIGLLLTFPPSDGKADSLKKDLINNINKYQDKLGKRIIILKDLDEEKKNNIKVMISVNYSRTDPAFGEMTKYSAIFAQTILFFPAAIVGLALDAATYPFKIVKSWNATIKCVSVPEGVEYEKSGSPNDISTEDHFFKKIQEAEFIAWISESNIPPLGFLNIIFQTGDEYFKWSILNALARTNKAATDLFFHALGDDSPKVRMYAAKALCNQNDPRGYNFLITALNDRDFLVRSNTIELLGKIDNSKAAEILASALYKGDFQYEVMGACTKIRGPISNRETMEMFVQALGNDNLRVRICAATVLCNLNDPRGYDVLQSTIQDKDFDLRLMTVKSLKEIKTSHAVQILVLALKDDLWGVQQEAIMALSEIKDTTAVKPLIDAFDKDNSYFVAMALKEITGQDFGEDKQRWQQWYEQGGIK